MTPRPRGVIEDSLIHPIAILFIGMFLVPMLTGLLGRLMGQSLGFDMSGPVATTVLSTVVVTMQGVALVGLTFRHVTNARGLDLSPRELGFTAQHWPAEVRIGLVWGMLLLIVNIVSSQLSQRLFRLLMDEDTFQQQLALEGADFVELVASGMPVWVIVVFALSSVVVAPVAEEVFFRGYVHAVFRARFPAHALFLSSALFAFVHFYVIHLIPVFLIGVLLAVLYQRRGSLVAPMVAHAFSNLVVVISMIVQGLMQAG